MASHTVYWALYKWYQPVLPRVPGYELAHVKAKEDYGREQSGYDSSRKVAYVTNKPDDDEAYTQPFARLQLVVLDHLWGVNHHPNVQRVDQRIR